MTVHITAAAARQLGKRAKNILFYCSSGGCNGLEYRLEPCSPSVPDVEALAFDFGTLYICNRSVFHVLGTRIDWKEDIMGARFVFDNPNAESTCGCGATFSA